MRWLIFIFCFSLLSDLVAAEFSAPRRVDERRAARMGLRKIVGQHLRLYTDLPSSDAVDSLPAVFDAAVPLWAEYFEIDGFEIDGAKLRNWRMQGYLMQDRAKFAALGLLPTENRDFSNGYSNGHELWVVEQSSDYYRRHLLLHEGTHGFMYTQLGDTGPGWYMEGMAELLGTHRWQDGQLRLGVMPAQREEVPMWGRIKLVREAANMGAALELPTVMGFDKRRKFSTTEYAWCWAMCHFLDSHPRQQEKFRELKQYLGQGNFNQNFLKRFRDDWRELSMEWRAFVADLDYGYDARRMAIQHKTTAPVTAKATVKIAADRGWQSTGWRLNAGKTYEVSAVGRYQIKSEVSGGKLLGWPCEPGGVTLEYHAGRPLGELQGAWRTVRGHQLSEPFAVGLMAKVEPSEDAVLYLRVNDLPAQLSDNQGGLSASIRRVQD